MPGHSRRTWSCNDREASRRSGNGPRQCGRAATDAACSVHVLASINDFEDAVAQADRLHQRSQFSGFLPGDLLKPPGEPTQAGFYLVTFLEALHQ
jgi:hypothetical protein